MKSFVWLAQIAARRPWLLLLLLLQLGRLAALRNRVGVGGRHGGFLDDVFIIVLACDLFIGI